MTAATQAPPTTAAPAPKPAPKATGPKVGEPLDPATLTTNEEGFVVVDPNAPGGGTKAADPITIVDSHLVLGYGGPLAVQNERGLSKAFTGDAVYDLSDGQRYVLPAPLAEALGTQLPAPSEAEVDALELQANLGVPTERLKKKQEAEDKKAAETKKV